MSIVDANTQSADVSGPTHSTQAEIAQSAARARLFLTSYAPLFAIFAIRFDPPHLRVACALVSVFGFVDLWRITHQTTRRAMPFTISIDAVGDVGGEVSGYLASYLLPFVTVSSPSVKDLIAYALFLLVAMAVYVRSDLVRVNPTLYLLLYRVVRIERGDQAGQYLITREEPTLIRSMQVVTVAGVLIDVGG
jgi:hypothetical protein